jgi:hypothetical protein
MINHLRPLENAMQTVDEALNLLKRQAELEAAMKSPHHIRIREEQELRVVRRQLQQFPEVVQAVVQAAHALRRPVTDVSADEIVSWAAATRAFR